MASIKRKQMIDEVERQFDSVFGRGGWLDNHWRETKTNDLHNRSFRHVAGPYRPARRNRLLGDLSFRGDELGH